VYVIDTIKAALKSPIPRTPASPGGLHVQLSEDGRVDVPGIRRLAPASMSIAQDDELWV